MTIVKFPNKLDEVLRQGTSRLYKKNGLIFFQDEDADRVFYLNDGSVRFSYYIGEKRRILGYADNEEFLGMEAVLINARCFEISAEAVCDCLVTVLARDVFIQLLKEPEFTFYCLQKISKKFLVFFKKTKSLYFLDSQKRVESSLLWMAEQLFSLDNQLKITLSHQELAELSNVHRVTATRVLNNLQEKSILKKNKKTIVITREGMKKLENDIDRED